MPYKIDQKDRKILKILKQNADYKIRKISQKTGIPVTTVHNRIQKLKQSGIIKKFTVELDQKKIGRPLSAHILVTVDYRELKAEGINQHQLAQKILKLPGAEEADVLTGEYDIIVSVQMKDIEELDPFLLKKPRNLPGVESTRTLVVLHSTRK